MQSILCRQSIHTKYFIAGGGGTPGDRDQRLGVSAQSVGREVKSKERLANSTGRKAKSEDLLAKSEK